MKKELAYIRNDIWSLNDCNETRNNDHSVRKRALNHLAKLNKLLSLVMSTYLYSAFDWMLLSCHIRISGWIYTQYLPECQVSPCPKQARYMKFKWLQRESNPQPLSWERKPQSFAQTDQTIGLNCEYLAVLCIWLYVNIISSMHFRVNPHSLFAWMSRNILLASRTISKV